MPIISAIIFTKLVSPGEFLIITTTKKVSQVHPKIDLFELMFSLEGRFSASGSLLSSLKVSFGPLSNPLCVNFGFWGSIFEYGSRVWVAEG